MSEEIDNRLKKLENEIHVLLWLHNDGDQPNSAQVKNSTEVFTKKSDTNCKCSSKSTADTYYSTLREIEQRRASSAPCPPPTCKPCASCQPCLPCKPISPCPSRKPCLDKNCPGKPVRRKCSCSPKRKNPSLVAINACLDNIKDNLEKGSEAIKNASFRMAEDTTCPAKKIKNCMCDELEKLARQLKNERDKRKETENLVLTLRTTLALNKKQIEDMMKRKRIALDVAKTLRDKYENLKRAREEMLERLDSFKKENAALSRKLLAEVKNRECSCKEDKKRMMEQMKMYTDEQLTLREENIKQLQESNKKLTSELQANKDQLAAMENKYGSAIKESNDIKEQVKQLERQNHCLIHQLAHNRRCYEQLTTDHEQLSAAAQKMKLDLKSAEEQLCHCKREASKSDDLKNLLDERTSQYDELQSRCDELERKLKEAQFEDEKRCQAVDAELKKFTDIMKEKESILKEEKEQMKKLVEDLNRAVEIHKKKIEELMKINKQQELKLKSYAADADSKDKRVRSVEAENETMKCKCQQYEGKICDLTRCLKNTEDKSAEIAQRIPLALEEAKDRVLVKEKIIEDQEKTIKELKKGIKEHKCMCEELEKLRRELAREKSHKQHIANEVIQAQKKKEQLTQRVNELQEELKKRATSNEELGKQRSLIESLERTVHSKQCEWELKQRALTKEKEDAMNAAKYASKKLFDTVEEFQKQMAAQKKVHHVLSSLLSEKEKQLKIANTKISAITSVLMKQNNFVNIQAGGDSNII